MHIFCASRKKVFLLFNIFILFILTAFLRRILPVPSKNGLLKTSNCGTELAFRPLDFMDQKKFSSALQDTHDNELLIRMSLSREVVTDSTHRKEEILALLE